MTPAVMKIQAEEIRGLAALARSLGLAMVEVADQGWSVRITVPGGAAPPRVAADQSAGLDCVPASSPGVGRFLPAHPMQPALIRTPGETVAAGDVLGLVACGPVYRPVVAPCAGALARRLVEPGTLVGYGTAIFEIRSTTQGSRPDQRGRKDQT